MGLFQRVKTLTVDVEEDTGVPRQFWMMSFRNICAEARRFKPETGSRSSVLVAGICLESRHANLYTLY